MKIATKRLSMRRIQLSDTENIRKLANYPAIAATTMRMPYPCTKEYIETWIKKDLESNDEYGGFFVISLKSANEIIGVIGLEIDRENERAELGYWLGLDYWNNGYCTEATEAMLKYGFDDLHLHRIWTFYIEGNDASGRVLEKIGMVHEGTLKKHLKKNSVFKDLEYYGKIK